jgi:chorismate dehydratase
MIRLGVVPYLNALPLYHTLQQRTLHASTGVEVMRAIPSQLAPQLARGECDVALIPIAEHFRGVGEEVISDACIGSSGAVRSVLLFHRVPVRDIKRVAADASSRTSVALLHIILEDAYGIAPAFREHAPNLQSMLHHNDAALLIGDSALEATPFAQRQGISILDLGAAWQELTGLSFVYAAWVTRRGLNSDVRAELAELLTAARDEGVPKIESIARQYATPTLPAATVESYLRHAIEYSLTTEHRAGMEEFRRRMSVHNLLGE